jgi:hypothetical protein
MFVTDSNLHALPWTPNNTSADVDNNLAQEIQMVSGSDYMTMSIADTRGDAGALCSLNRPVPIIDGLPLAFLRVLWNIRPSRTAAKENRVYETDTILVWPPSLDDKPVSGQWFNGSFQANQISKHFQVIKAGKWIDSNVTAGAIYQPNVWNSLQLDYQFDYAGKTVSVNAINGAAVDPTLLKLPATSNNWSRSVAGMPHQPLLKLQAQAHLLVPGAFEIDYQVSLLWSDNPQFA